MFFLAPLSPALADALVWPAQAVSPRLSGVVVVGLGSKTKVSLTGAPRASLGGRRRVEGRAEEVTPWLLEVQEKRGLAFLSAPEMRSYAVALWID